MVSSIITIGATILIIWILAKLAIIAHNSTTVKNESVGNALSGAIMFLIWLILSLSLMFICAYFIYEKHLE